jgi:hypothetical protein
MASFLSLYFSFCKLRFLWLVECGLLGFDIFKSVLGEDVAGRGEREYIESCVCCWR